VEIHTHRASDSQNASPAASCPRSSPRPPPPGAAPSPSSSAAATTTTTMTTTTTTTAAAATAAAAGGWHAPRMQRHRRGTRRPRGPPGPPSAGSRSRPTHLPRATPPTGRTSGGLGTWTWTRRPAAVGAASTRTLPASAASRPRCRDAPYPPPVTPPPVSRVAAAWPCWAPATPPRPRRRISTVSLAPRVPAADAP